MKRNPIGFQVTNSGETESSKAEVKKKRIVKKEPKFPDVKFVSHIIQANYDREIDACVFLCELGPENEITLVLSDKLMKEMDLWYKLAKASQAYDEFIMKN